MKPQRKSQKTCIKVSHRLTPVRLVENITMQRYNIQNPPFTVSHGFSLIFTSFSEEVTYLRYLSDLFRMQEWDLLPGDKMTPVTGFSWNLSHVGGREAFLENFSCPPAWEKVLENWCHRCHPSSEWEIAAGNTDRQVHREHQDTGVADGLLDWFRKVCAAVL